MGATHDDFGFRKKLTAEGLSYLSQIVSNIMPALASQPILDIWCGIRPNSRDGLPTLGADPRTNGGYLWAAGHAASGMMQAPATAKVLTDLVLGRKPRIPIDQLRSERHQK